MVFDTNTTASDVIAQYDLCGRNAIVTGGTSGLGAETARVLASAGAQVTLAGKDRVKGETVADRIRRAVGNQKVTFRHLDLGSLASVRTFADDYLGSRLPLHLLINNAAIMAAPLAYTEDRFETQFGINHIGHFALTIALLPALKTAKPARVVSLTSRAHRRGDLDFADPNYYHRPYDPWQAYGQSKTANALFSVGLTLMHRTNDITSNAVMPGTIHTGLQRYLDREQLISLGWVKSGNDVVPGPNWKTVEQGAATTIWAAVAPELDGVGGCYLQDCAIGRQWTQDDAPPNGYFLPYAMDPLRAERLWKLSSELIT